MELALPHPPSVNHYWRHVGAKVLISKRGRQYRKAVAAAVAERRAERKCCQQPMTGRLELTIWLFPPTTARRDVDNYLKAVLDSLEYAGVYEDDSQIDRLVIERGKKIKGGGVDVMIQPYGGT